VRVTVLPVLIQGETGTGKELVARAIHRQSDRRTGPFVPVNCSLGPSALLENELFGHERGAFTGAEARHRGHIERADGGTLFLDEIGELPMESQAKLLRAISEREVRRLGGGEPIPVDFRLIAATNVNLLAAVHHEAFRADLYYRIDALSLSLPPLRERQDDIDLLLDVLVARLTAAHGLAPCQLSTEARRALLSYQWPGNVREMENVLLKGLLACGGGLVRIEHLPGSVVRRSVLVASQNVPPLAEGETLPDGLYRVTLAHERRWVTDALEASKGQVQLAAQRLGINRRTLYSIIKKLGIRRTGRSEPERA
jgi:DNA-binding NtrC family response regulator